MTIEIDADIRLAVLRTRLDAVLVDLAAQGVEARWCGRAALAVLRGLEPSPLDPLLLAVGERHEQVRRSHPTLDAAVRYRIAVVGITESGVCAPGAIDDPAGQARAFSIAVGADGAALDPLGALADFDAGLLLPRDDWAIELRGHAEAILSIAAATAATGLMPPAEAIRTMTRDSGHLLTTPRRAWREGLDRVLTGPHASLALSLLLEVRALPLLLHEVAAMVDFHKSCPVHHKDIWDHTLQVVDKCPPLRTVRWAALMHDSGKVWTRTVTGRGKVHFFRHEELGASLMRGVAARFEMTDDEVDPICYVIANHARANVYSTEWTDAAVRRLIRDMGEHLDAVLAFSRSDFTTKRAWRIREVRELGEELLRRIDAIAAADARVPPLPKGFGNLVMAHSGRRGGPWLGEIQALLEAEVEQGRLPAGESGAFYLDWLVRNAPDRLAAPTAAAAAQTTSAPTSKADGARGRRGRRATAAADGGQRASVTEAAADAAAGA